MIITLQNIGLFIEDHPEFFDRPQAIIRRALAVLEHYGNLKERDIAQILNEDDKAIFGSWGGPHTRAFFTDYGSLPKHIMAVILRNSLPAVQFA